MCQSVPLQVKIDELWESGQSFGLQRREVVVRQVQIHQVPHSTEGPSFDFVDFAEVQVQRHNSTSAREASGGDEMEVVATEIEQLRPGWEAPRDFVKTMALTRGVVSFSLRWGESERKKAAVHLKS